MIIRLAYINRHLHLFINSWNKKLFHEIVSIQMIDIILTLPKIESRYLVNTNAILDSIKFLSKIRQRLQSRL